MNTPSLLRRWFDGRLSSAKATRLFELARQDPAMRREYNRLLELEAALTHLEPAAGGLSHFERERIENYVVEDTLLREGARKSVSAWLRLAPALGLALLALLVLPLVWLSVDRPTRDGISVSIPAALFAPRGFDAPYETHLFLFCVEDGPQRVDVQRLDRPPALWNQAESCGLKDQLQFALTNLGDAYRYLYVFGIDERQRRLWYFPKPGQGRSQEVSTAVAEQLLGDSILLHVNHQSGQARIFAVFSRSPLSDREIDEAVERMRGADEPLALPIEQPGAYIESFPILIRAGGKAL